MIYFDTNVIVYSVVNQDVGKKVLARDKIFTAKKLNQFQLSPLLLHELVFSLAKLKMNGEAIGRIFKSYKIYSDYNIDNDLIFEAFAICEELNYYSNINDCIHLKFAERYCDKLITFDKDFEKFRPHTKLEIEILS